MCHLFVFNLSILKDSLKSLVVLFFSVCVGGVSGWVLVLVPSGSRGVGSWGSGMWLVPDSGSQEEQGVPLTTE